MDPFATVAEYRARYPDDEVSDEVLEECLMDATDLISGELDGSDIEYVGVDEPFARRLMRVCRDVVHRAIGSGGSDVPFGATQLSETASQFSASVQLANPYGDLFITEQERRSLGIGAMRATVLSPYC
jgi:hypothetical protein